MRRYIGEGERFPRSVHLNRIVTLVRRVVPLLAVVSSCSALEDGERNQHHVAQHEEQRRDGFAATGEVDVADYQ